MLADVDQARSHVKNDILAKYAQQIDNCSKVSHMVPPTIKVIKQLSEKILNAHYSFVDNSL